MAEDAEKGSLPWWMNITPPGTPDISPLRLEIPAPLETSRMSPIPSTGLHLDDFSTPSETPPRRSLTPRTGSSSSSSSSPSKPSLLTRTPLSCASDLTPTSDLSSTSDLTPTRDVDVALPDSQGAAAAAATHVETSPVDEMVAKNVGAREEGGKEAGIVDTEDGVGEMSRMGGNVEAEAPRQEEDAVQPVGECSANAVDVVCTSMTPDSWCKEEIVPNENSNVLAATAEASGNQPERRKRLASSDWERGVIAKRKYV